MKYYLVIFVSESVISLINNFKMYSRSSVVYSLNKWHLTLTFGIRVFTVIKLLGTLYRVASLRGILSPLRWMLREDYDTVAITAAM